MRTISNARVEIRKAKVLTKGNHSTQGEPNGNIDECLFGNPYVEEPLGKCVLEKAGEI